MTLLCSPVRLTTAGDTGSDPGDLLAGHASASRYIGDGAHLSVERGADSFAAFDRELVQALFGPLVAGADVADGGERVVCHASDGATPTAGASTRRPFLPVIARVLPSATPGGNLMDMQNGAPEDTTISTYFPQIGDHVTGSDGNGITRTGYVCGPVTVAGDPVAVADLGVIFLPEVQRVSEVQQ